MSLPSNAELRRNPAFQKVNGLIDQPGKRDLLWYFDLGKQVQKLCPSEDRAYGEGRIQNLTSALGRSESFADTLWKARSFAEKYKRANVRNLCNSGILTWSHLVLLLPLEDNDRQHFQELCHIEELSSKALRSRLKEIRKPQSQGGRRFQKPANVDDAVRELIRESQTWDRRFREIWFQKDHPAIHVQAGKPKSTELPELAAEAFDILKTMQSDIDEALPQLKQLVAKHKKKTKRRSAKR